MNSHLTDPKSKNSVFLILFVSVVTIRYIDFIGIQIEFIQIVQTCDTRLLPRSTVIIKYQFKNVLYRYLLMLL